MIRKFTFILVALGFSLLYAQKLNGPESICYDSISKTYYISNTGDGSIVQSPDLKSYSYLGTGMGAVRGLHIRDRKLYAATQKGLAVFDLKTGKRELLLDVPGSQFLNDVVSDNSGNIYLTDHVAHKIFHYDPQTKKLKTLIEKGISSPNGIVFDKANQRLLFVSLRANSPIQSISLPEGKLGNYKSTNLGSLDGLGLDSKGNLYVSSWKTSSIYRIPNSASKPEQLITGLSGPADFLLREIETTDSKGKKHKTIRLFVPLMNQNTIAIRDIN
ncbi:MAG: SMP-30/gluconolactonase/LRE family protein [Candidatus Cloacimonetes bacterium]|nr:SMP-30/gluconolactonase/LRE family protein [Candidatus Cloacimonadota bacterium]